MGRVCVCGCVCVVAAGSELITTPFPCCVLPNFIQDKDGFLDSLKDEILRLKYYEKDNDLYQFRQVCAGTVDFIILYMKHFSPMI